MNHAKNIIALTALVSGVALTPLTAFAAPLTIQNYVADDKGFSVTASLISGKKEAVLVNGLFNQSDALRVAADILDSGKTLKTIFVSYGDPDFYFGLQTLQRIFPKAQIIATPYTVQHIQATKDLKLKYWAPQMGNNAPSQIVVPASYTSQVIQLEDEKIQIKGNGKLTYLWVPSAKAVVGGIAVTAGQHLWMADDATPKAQQALVKTLQDIKTLNPDVVVPGHSTKDAKFDQSAVNFSINYLEQYQKAAASSKNSAQLIETMQQSYADLPGASSLELGAKVVKGEMKWP